MTNTTTDLQSMTFQELLGHIDDCKRAVYRASVMRRGMRPALAAQDAAWREKDRRNRAPNGGRA